MHRLAWWCHVRSPTQASDPRTSVKMARTLVPKFPGKSPQVMKMNEEYIQRRCPNIFFLWAFLFWNLSSMPWLQRWSKHQSGILMSFDKYKRSYRRTENRFSHNGQTPTTRNTVYWHESSALCKGLRWKVWVGLKPGLHFSYWVLCFLTGLTARRKEWLFYKLFTQRGHFSALHKPEWVFYFKSHKGPVSGKGGPTTNYLH